MNVLVVQTEFEFVLPKGHVDEQGSLHRDGVVILATAADRILPFEDPVVQFFNAMKYPDDFLKVNFGVDK